MEGGTSCLVALQHMHLEAWTLSTMVGLGHLQKERDPGHLHTPVAAIHELLVLKAQKTLADRKCQR